MSQAQSRPIRAPIRWRCVFVLSALILLLHPRSPALAQVPNQPETDAGPLAANDIVPLAVDDRQKTRRPVVLDVRFVGNHHTKDVQIFNKVKTRPKMEFDSEQLEKDVHGLNSTGRFSNVIPHTKYTRDGVIVTFELIERPVIGYIEHLGNRGMSEKKLTKEHGLKVGDALSPFNVKEGRRKMEELYHQNGFPKATVLVQEGESPKDKGVVYVINEGPIQRVAHVYFTGNRLATSGRLSTFIQSKPGSFSYASPFFSNRFERQKLEQDLEVLRKYYRSLGYFKAEISREVTTDDSGKWVDINFIIDEGPRYNIRNIEITGSNK